MNRYIPTVYKKSVFDINYENLYNIGIRHLMFDLDNTLTWAKSKEVTTEIRELIKKLKNKFTVDIVSNSRKRRVASIAKKLDVGYVSFARKPSVKSFIIIQDKYNCGKEEMIIIGDQLLTDIKAGNKYGIKTLLIDPIGNDLFVTYYNRWRESMKIKKMAEAGILERGKYYE